MKKLLTLFLISLVSISFAAPDTLYYCEHKGGINGAWLDSNMQYIPDPSNASFTEEMWNTQHQEFISHLNAIIVDNTSAIVKELMRCPNSRQDKPRYKIENGQIVPTADVLDITIPTGYTGINPDGTLTP